MTILLLLAVAVPWFTGGRADVIPPPPHLAALPCEAPAGADAARALCDGLTDVLIGKLARLTASTHAITSSLDPDVSRIRSPETQ